eukprot:10251301-Alexandrium_andersonii.AAC.1
MSASLVGSEMCIRDSTKALWRVRLAPSYWCEADLKKWLTDWGWSDLSVVAPPSLLGGVDDPAGWSAPCPMKLGSPGRSPWVEGARM